MTMKPLRQSAAPAARVGRAWNVALWVAQAALGLQFIAIGLMKLTSPIPKLAATMHWTAEMPELFVRAIGAIDVAGGVGVVLPALLRIRPGLTVAAALGCTVLQILALIFHLSRGEVSVAPLNLVLLALAGFVLWGRGRKAPIRPRGA